MIATTVTAEQFSDRIKTGANRLRMERTPMMRAVDFLEKVAREASELGKQGHSVKGIEIITREDRTDPFAMELKWDVRIVPAFKLKEPVKP